MKKIIALFSPISSDKIKMMFDEIQELTQENPNKDISPLVSGIAFCKENFIENGMITGNLILSGEKNDNNGATKLEASFYNISKKTTKNTILIYLSNGECKEFGSESLANSAFENNLFSFESKKEKNNYCNKRRRSVREDF